MEKRNYENKIKFLEKSTYEEIRKSERQQIKKSLIPLLGFVSIVIVIVPAKFSSDI